MRVSFQRSGNWKFPGYWSCNKLHLFIPCFLVGDKNKDEVIKLFELR